MAEEFVDILDDIKRKPMEKRIQALGDIVEKLIQTILNVSNNTEIMLNSFRKEIDTLEQQIKVMRVSQTNIDIKQLKLKPPEPLQPSQLTPKPIPPIPTRSMIVGELNELFKNNKKKKNIKNDISI